MTTIRHLAINPDPTVEWVDITPAIASEYLGKNHGNRNKRPVSIASYVRDMRNGDWLQTGDAVRFDTNGRMIDGQHRCEAIIESGVTCRTLVITGLDPQVRDVLDTNVRRSAIDALSFNGIGKHRAILSAMARLDAAYQSGEMKSTTITSGKVTNSEVVAWVAEHPESIDAAAWSSRIFRDLCASPTTVAYAIWKTMLVAPDDASEFWNSMANFQTGGPGDPRHAAIRRLRNDAETGLRSASGRELFILFRAWNAYRDGETLQKISLESRAGAGIVPEPK
ncbi:MAG: hypothetical protein WBA98_08185 [Gordonia sp. (in: high G+C Gram-positive bacteria)]|uniref:hypothetical protein n=1 Tax=Gordonia sp. (in: high G+C Gram-positive bacteria) TaxID=84139 RepID=UPI003C71C4C1